jgi:DNA-binding transcriptional LysR family regulator
MRSSLPRRSRSSQRLFRRAAVSQAIGALEREAGATLVDRGPRGVRLTEAGAVLARHAAALRERLDLAVRELDDIT